MLDVEAFILVGGQSSRMGSDKSQLKFAGQTSVELIANALRGLASDVRLVGGNSAVSQELQTVPDVHERWGALGGIHAALTASRTEWALIVACDLPLVTKDLFSKLTSVAEVDSFDAVVPVQNDGRVQPLCGVYRRARCLAESELLISAGEHMPRSLLNRVRTRRVAFAELSHLEGAEYFFFNVNTPIDYERAQQLIGHKIATT
jgi:molybdopterin-guanine dinucleotide biosynthesis protein A